MLILAALLLAGPVAYGPIRDPRTGQMCPPTKYKLGLWDEPDFSARRPEFTADDILNMRPGDAAAMGDRENYCMKLRYNALYKQRRATRKSSR